MYKRNDRIRAFTLIELLVVISIISLLSSVVFTSLGSTRVKSRNAARIQGILTLRNAFYLGLSGGQSFPANVSLNYNCVSATCSGFPAGADIDAYLAPNLPQKPVDPVGGTRSGYFGYLYLNPVTPSGLSNGAYLFWYLEPPASCAPGINFGGAADYVFCLLRIDN